MRHQLMGGESAIQEYIPSTTGTRIELLANVPSSVRQRIAGNGRLVTVVTGLPRSGTSMMMQMLKAGGFKPLTDCCRPSDQDNPPGYFELEAVMHLRDQPDWVAAARGKVIKVVAPTVSVVDRSRRDAGL